MTLESDEDITDVIELSREKAARGSANKDSRESEGLSYRKSRPVEVS